MNNEQILKGRISDLAKSAYHQNVYKYSQFLTPEELTMAKELSSSLSYITMRDFGGHPLSERRILCFGSEEEFGYPENYPITIIRISPLIEKFSDTLSHRDYLGALMNLGVKRETLGDIMIKEPVAYVFCLTSISEYIVENLTKIKHTHVKCEITDVDIPDLKPTLKDEEFPVASLRLDGIIANLTKSSRKETLQFFENKLVTLNGNITGRNSILLKEGDTFSVRGYGKFIFIGVKGNTKKGKLFIHVKRYV